MLYCKSSIGFSLNSLADISSSSFTGKASSEGFPAERETTDGSEAYLKISLIALGFRLFVLSEKVYSIIICAPYLT